MIRHSHACIPVALVMAVLPVRAANRPHAGMEDQTIKVWTNDDIEKLRGTEPVSIVGQLDEAKNSESTPQGYPVTQDPAWYAGQAARLQKELDQRQAELREYRQAIDDARSLRETTAGIDLVGADFAITPEAGIQILEQRVNDTETELDDLEDLARRNDIEPGTLRGQ
jgi:hypothetical protein